MKKVTLLSLILILLAISVVPVMAAGPDNGHGNGVSSGQGNSAGAQTRQQAKEQIKLQDRENKTNRGVGKDGNQGRMRTPFYLQGTIKEINPTTKTLTITLIHGNAQVKPFFSTGLTMQVTDGTKIFQLTQVNEGEDIGESVAPATSGESITTNSDDDTPGNRVPITFDQLLVGQKVAIHGNVVASAFNATLVTIYIQTPPVPPG